MVERRRRCRWVGTPPGLVVLLLFLLVPPLVAGQEGGDPVSRIRKLLESMGIARFATPVPGSRSVAVAVDGSSDLYLFVQRGSIRGSAIDTFYEQLESGDLAAAYQTFSDSSITVLSASDYGWNGLGIPLEADDDMVVDDVFYKVVDGRIRHVEIAPEDVEQFNDLLLEVVIPALEKVAEGP